MSCLKKYTLPVVGDNCPLRMLNKVVFPAPLGPMIASLSPACTLKERSDNAWTPPKFSDRWSTFNASILLTTDLYF